MNPASPSLFDNQLLSAVDRLEPIANRVGMAAVSQGHMLVQQRLRVSHHAGPAGRIVPRSRLALFPGKHVGAVESIVETAPAGVGGVQAIPGVVDRDNQLGPGDRGDFWVDIGRFDGERPLVTDQVSDLGQEIAGLRATETRFPSLEVPRVDLPLQFVTACQQPAVAGIEVGDDLAQGGPEPIRIHPGARCDLVMDQFVQARIDQQATHFNAFTCHRVLLLLSMVVYPGGGSP